MKRFELNCGHSIPAIGLGTWKSQHRDAYHAVKEAIQAGYRHLDCAFIYGNEKEVGEAVAECIADGIVARGDLFITSKLWNSFHRPEDVRAGIEKSLADLGLGYLDLYLVHWPLAFQPGVSFPAQAEDFLPLTEAPLATTWAQMEALAEAGLARSIGVSNFSVSKLEALLSKARIRPAANQVELHPFLAQRDLVEYCHRQGIHVTAYSPLGSRDRIPAMKQPNEPSLLDDGTVAEVAKAAGLTPGQVLIAWAVARGTSVIPKSTNPGRIRENLAAGDHELATSAVRALTDLDRGFRFVNPKSMFVAGVTHEGDDFWA